MITINFSLLGSVVLTILGIIALVFLILFLKNLNSLIQKIQGLLEKNEDNLDQVIDKLPQIADQADILVGNINSIVADPNLKMAIAKANDTMTNVNSITDDIRDTVNYVGVTAVDSIDTLGAGVASVTDYSTLIMDVIDIARNVISGK
ncbi:MAG: hypothetical protein Q4D88_02625 [Anaerococcus sp.]|nr:hypothetical protein [Anaerococcus sp.]